MALQNFDQLNNIATNWFEGMGVSVSEKKKRIDLSLDYCEIIIMLFQLIEGNHPKESCVEFAEERLKIIAENYVGKRNIAYINDWSHKEAEKIVDVTIRNEEKISEDSEDKEIVMEFGNVDMHIPEKEYWTSEERGLLIGVECATITANFDDLSRAMDRKCTRKTWITEADDRVRKTHEAVHGTEIAINDYFQVGNSYLLFPGDISRDAEDKEICGCRCFCEYF